jgi:hypothetical protein
MEILALSPNWRSLGEHTDEYVRSGKSIGLVAKVGSQYYAQAERRPGSTLQLGRFNSRLAAMAVVQDALIGPASQGAALGRAALAAEAAPESDDEHRLVAWDVLNSVGTWR